MTEVKYCYRHPDRETGLSCSECGRPICVDCMSVAPVGIRCPEHAGRPTSAPARMTRTVRRASYAASGSIVTRVLVGLNVAIYLAELAGGARVNANSGWIFDHGALVVSALYSDGSPAGLHHGEWWRLISAAFLHYGPIHLGMNMLALWWLGAPVEMALGRSRFLLLYLVSGLAGSAGALIGSPHGITVGASGAIFGMLGAGLILEYEATGRLGGNYLTLIIINLAFTFAVPNISVGGHLGGLAGGIVGTLVITQVARRRLSLRDSTALSVAGLVAIGIVSIAIAYWRVRGMA